MSFDDEMKEILQIFCEESTEGLDAMETGLLNLDYGQPDLEIINDIFRAAHSIKGGAATFGFTIVSDFTHHVETLLDEMRTGNRPVTAETVPAAAFGGRDSRDDDRDLSRHRAGCDQ